MMYGLATLDLPGFLKYWIDPDMCLRIACATIAGALIGIERERHGRAAGLRTTLLVSLASCIAMIISDSFYVDSFNSQQRDPSGWHPDPARLAAGVLAGMGFLGAGVIIRQGNHLIRGVTTAATLWLVTMLGLAFGAGSYAVGIVGTISSLLILLIIPYIESHIRNDWYSNLGVTFSVDHCSIDEIVTTLKPLNVLVKNIDIDEDLVKRRCHVILHLRYKRVRSLAISNSITEKLHTLKGVHRITFKDS